MCTSVFVEESARIPVEDVMIDLSGVAHRTVHHPWLAMALCLLLSGSVNLGKLNKKDPSTDKSMSLSCIGVMKSKGRRLRLCEYLPATNTTRDERDQACQ